MNPTGTQNPDDAPVPGGDPDQAPPDLPKPPNRPITERKKGNPEEYGHVGTDDRPQRSDRPKPKQIY